MTGFAGASSCTVAFRASSFETEPSARPAGLALAHEDGERWFDAPVIEARNAVGAGDALVAGLGCALERSESLEDAVLAGIASAAASVEQELPGRLDLARAEQLRRAVQ